MFQIVEIIVKNLFYSVFMLHFKMFDKMDTAVVILYVDNIIVGIHREVNRGCIMLKMKIV